MGYHAKYLGEIIVYYNRNSWVSSNFITITLFSCVVNSILWGMLNKVDLIIFAFNLILSISQSIHAQNILIENVICRNPLFFTKIGAIIIYIRKTIEDYIGHNGSLTLIAILQ